MADREIMVITRETLKINIDVICFIKISLTGKYDENITDTQLNSYKNVFHHQWQ